MSDNRSTLRDEYYNTCIRRGVDPQTAEKIADGLIESRKRKAEADPGWETLCHKIPTLIRTRCVHLYSAASYSCLSDSITDQSMSGLQSVLSYGVLLGMMLAENGHRMSDREREAADKNIPDIRKWIEELDAERKENTNSADND